MCGILQIPRLIVTLLQIIGAEQRRHFSVLCFRVWFFPLRQRYVHTTAFCQSQEVRFSVILCSEKWISNINHCYKCFGCLMYYTNYCVRVKATWEAEQTKALIRHIWIPKTPMDLHSAEATGIQYTFNAINLTNGMDIAHLLPLWKHKFFYCWIRFDSWWCNAISMLAVINWRVFQPVTSFARITQASLTLADSWVSKHS